MFYSILYQLHEHSGIAGLLPVRTTTTIRVGPGGVPPSTRIHTPTPCDLNPSRGGAGFKRVFYKHLTAVTQLKDVSMPRGYFWSLATCGKPCPVFHRHAPPYHITRTYARVWDAPFPLLSSRYASTSDGKATRLAGDAYLQAMAGVCIA